jgi:pimeloyl-ACP methyl ester carboxylesterase
MIRSLAKFLDWSAIQIATTMKPADDSDSTLEEAVHFLKSPAFIAMDDRAAQVEFDNSLQFRFPTSKPCKFTENNVAHGRFYRCAGRWQEQPVIILLHGNGDSLNYNFLFPSIAGRCNRMGFSAATLMAPYFFRRRPRQLDGSLGFSGCLQFAEATAQALAEIRALTGWLLAQGCPSVALWGYSMGAWYAGMAVCQDARLSTVVLAAPSARLNPWIETYTMSPHVRRNLPKVRERCEALNLTTMNLTMHRPVIAREKILIIEGIHDLMSPNQNIEDLWQAWKQPDIWRLPYGHVGVCCGFVPGLSQRVLNWLTPRLEGGRKSNV